MVSNFNVPKPLDDRGSIQSARNFNEFNCTSRQMRIAEVSFHTGVNAGGRILHSNFNPSDWVRVAPGTVGERLMNFACGR